MRHEYGIKACRALEEVPHHEFEAIVLCVAHKQFLTTDLSKLKTANGIVYDVKGILDKAQVDGRL